MSTADVLDAVSWAILGAVGCTPADSRAVLATLWTTDTTVDPRAGR